VLGLFFLSGACGLVYEITWMRLFRLAMGNTVFTSATVLTTFMAGLALGSFLASRLADRLAHPLRLYAVLEILIGLCGLALPGLFAAVEPLYARLYGYLGNAPFLLGLGRFSISAALLVLPTTLMGATLPLLGRFLSRQRATLGRDLGRLYAFNTLGAALGAAGTGFALVPGLGVQATLIGAALTNLLIGGVSLWISRAPLLSSPAIHVGESPLSGDRALLCALALTGFASMTYEVAWTRTLSLLLGSSVYAFALMLVAFIAGLGLGSLVLAPFIDRRPNLLLVLGALELAMGLSALLVEPLFGLLPLYVIQVVSRHAGSFASLHLMEFLMAFALMLLPTFAGGSLFPAAARLYTPHLARVGRSVGHIYAANTLGAVLGSFGAGFLLIPLLGAQATLLSAVALNLLLGLYFLRRSGWLVWPGRMALVSGLVFLVLAAVARLAPWDAALLNSAPYLYAGQYLSAARQEGNDLARTIKKDRRLLYLQEGLTATVTVWDWRGERFMRAGGKVIASSQGKDLRSHSLLAHLPLLLHPDPRGLLLIGLGAGITLGAAQQHSLERIECVELSPEVVQAAALFSQVNHDALSDPRLKMVVADGRNHLALGKGAYDVIISQPSTLWIAGMADLFTREFFVACRRRLAPGGLACTWVQAYALSAEDFKSIVATFSSVFPHVSLWELMPGIDYLLVGSQAPLSLRYADLAGRLVDRRLAEDLRRSGAGHGLDLICSFVMQGEQLDALVEKAPLNTDDNALLEFSAPRGLYRDLSRPGYSLALETLRPYRQQDLSFLEGEFGNDLERAWQARGLALEGLLLEQGGQYEQALERLEEAAAYRASDMEVRRAFPELTFKLAEQYLRQGRPEEALALYHRLLGALPGHAAGHYREGELHEHLRQWEEALHSYARAAELAPEFLPSHLRLGALHARLRHFDQAVAAYRQGLQTHPDNADLLNNLGALLLVQGHLAQGLEVFHQLLALDSTDARAWNNLGTAYLRQRDYARARAFLEEAVARRGDDPLLHKKLAEAYGGLGQTEQARRALRQALELQPKDAQARHLLERLEQEAGER
jgi:spermidine synthase